MILLNLQKMISQVGQNIIHNLGSVSNLSVSAKTSVTIDTSQLNLDQISILKNSITEMLKNSEISKNVNVKEKLDILNKILNNQQISNAQQEEVLEFLEETSLKALFNVANILKKIFQEDGIKYFLNNAIYNEFSNKLVSLTPVIRLLNNPAFLAEGKKKGSSLLLLPESESQKDAFKADLDAFEKIMMDQKNVSVDLAKLNLDTTAKVASLKNFTPQDANKTRLKTLIEKMVTTNNLTGAECIILGKEGILDDRGYVDNAKLKDVIDDIMNINPASNNPTTIPHVNSVNNLDTAKVALNAKLDAIKVNIDAEKDPNKKTEYTNTLNALKAKVSAMIDSNKTNVTKEVEDFVKKFVKEEKQDLPPIEYGKKATDEEKKKVNKGSILEITDPNKIEKAPKGEIYVSVGKDKEPLKIAVEKDVSLKDKKVEVNEAKTEAKLIGKDDKLAEKATSEEIKGKLFEVSEEGSLPEGMKAVVKKTSEIKVEKGKVSEVIGKLPKDGKVTIEVEGKSFDATKEQVEELKTKKSFITANGIEKKSDTIKENVAQDIKITFEKPITIDENNNIKYFDEFIKTSDDGFIKKSWTWIKNHPKTSIGIGAGVVAGAGTAVYFAVKSSSSDSVDASDE